MKITVIYRLVGDDTIRTKTFTGPDAKDQAVAFWTDEIEVIAVEGTRA